MSYAQKTLDELIENIEAAKLIVMEKEKVMERLGEFFRDRMLNSQEHEMKKMYEEVQKKWAGFIAKQNSIMLEVRVLQRFKAPVPVGFEDRVRELSLQSQEICESLGKLTIQLDLVDLSRREPLVQFYGSMMGYIASLRVTIANVLEIVGTNYARNNGNLREKIFEWATTSGEMYTELSRHLLYIPTDHREDNELQRTLVTRIKTICASSWLLDYAEAVGNLSDEMEQYGNRIAAYENELEALTTAIWSFLDYE